MLVAPADADEFDAIGFEPSCDRIGLALLLIRPQAVVLDEPLGLACHRSSPNMRGARKRRIKGLGLGVGEVGFDGRQATWRESSEGREAADPDQHQSRD